MVQQLERQGIILAVREISDQKLVRASPHFFNTEKEILGLVDLIKKL
jgi:cysteine desulfurase/selenocysteine lyase